MLNYHVLESFSRRLSLTMAVRDPFSCKTEETKLSDRYGAYGILSSIMVSIVVGWGYILGLTFTVIDPTSLLDPANDAGGYAVAQLFYGIFRDRYGSGTGGIVCLGIIAVAVYLGGLGCVTSNSRYELLVRCCLIHFEFV